MLRTALLVAAAAPLGALAVDTWSIIAANVGTVATGISFNADGKTGFLPADDNGSGDTVLLTTDGGNTWNRHAKIQFDLILLDVASFDNNVAMTGVLSCQYSSDTGSIFNSSINGASASQCVRTLGPHDTPIGFGIPVDGGAGTEGVAISTNGGVSYTHYYAPQVKTGSRYAVFPSASQWYLVAGEWPGESPLEEEAAELGLDLAAGDKLHRFTERIHIAKWANGTSRFITRRPSLMSAEEKAKRVGKNNGMYLMQIVATTNTGANWTLQYNETHEWYGNGIECTTETNCCVVGEADTGAAAGSYIWCTNNGGQTWAVTHNNTDPNSSLVDIAAVGPNELWATGGEFGAIGPTAAHFWHSLDGGQTWNLDSTIPNQYAIAVDCVPGVANCWAVTVDLDQQASVASITSNSTRRA